VILSTEKTLFSIKNTLISLGVGIAIVMLISWTYIFIDIITAANPIEQSKYFFEWLYTDWNLFKYVDIHPTYFSLMLVLFTSSLIFEKSFSNFRNNKVKFGITVSLLIIFLLEANSRISIIGMIMIMVLMGIRQFDKKGILILLISILLVISIGSQFDYLVAKFSKVFDTSGNLNFERLLRWKEIINIFLQKESLFFGVGAGTTKEIYTEAYINGGFNLALRQSYNAHNQYLEFFVSNGILGLLIYISSLVYFAIKTKLKSFAFLFIIVIVLFSLTESFLDRSKGVFFFATFFSLLLNIYNRYPNEFRK
jgi:O-antigen ligase